MALDNIAGAIVGEFHGVKILQSKRQYKDTYSLAAHLCPVP
jgi:hypothetical protein